MFYDGRYQTYYSDDDRPKRIKDFIEEVCAVCKKYNLVIAHEDPGGGFILFDADDDADNWWFREADYVIRKDVAK